MAAAGLYTFGGSFWEFGEPDWEHTSYFLLFGVAEDHASNPIKIALGKLKTRGVKVVSVNPVRTGYNAIADEWIGIRPGTDGLFVAALIHELLQTAEDRCRLSGALHQRAVAGDPRSRRRRRRPVRARRGRQAAGCTTRPRARSSMRARRQTPQPALSGTFTLADGRKAVPVFQLLAERFLSTEYAPERAAKETGVPAATIRRIAAELAHAAFEEEIDARHPLDRLGRAQRHEKMIGRPVAMHAMRGISAHSNGFHTCRILHLLQILLGSIDCPGGFRYKPPYPKPAPPPKPRGKPGDVQAEQPLPGPPLGFPHRARRICWSTPRARRSASTRPSWDAPLAAHGLMHMVITNAASGDPYPIDVLFMYMANMGWNSSMNMPATLAHLTEKDAATGEYKIPKIIYSDAYSSEMVAYADLILPDTTYLERWDCISLLDRPISEPDGPADAIRQPVVAPDRDVRAVPGRADRPRRAAELPGFVNEDGAPKYPGGYPDYIVNHERQPGHRPAGRLPRR